MATTDSKHSHMNSASRDNLLNSDLLVKILGNDAMQMLRCGVCLEFFDNPTVLPCGHTFCLGCLAEMCRHAAISSATPVQMRCVRVACPNCRVLIYASPILEKNVTCNFILQSLLDCLKARPSSVKDVTTVAPRSPATPLSDQEILHVTRQVDALLQATKPTSLLDHAAAEIEEIRSQSIAESAKLKKALTGQREGRPSHQEDTKSTASTQKQSRPCVQSFKQVSAFPIPPPEMPQNQLNFSIAPPVGSLNLLPAPPGFKQAPIFVPQNSMAKQATSNQNYNLHNINKHYTPYSNNVQKEHKRTFSENINCNTINNTNLQTNQQNNKTNIGNYDKKMNGMMTSRPAEMQPIKKNFDISNKNNGMVTVNNFNQSRFSNNMLVPAFKNNCNTMGQNATSMQSSVFGSYTKSGFVPGKSGQHSEEFMNIIDKPTVNNTAWNINGFGSVIGEELGYNSKTSAGFNTASKGSWKAGEVAIGGEGDSGRRIGNVYKHLNNDPAVMSVVTSSNENCFKHGF